MHSGEKNKQKQPMQWWKEEWSSFSDIATHNVPKGNISLQWFKKKVKCKSTSFIVLHFVVKVSRQKLVYTKNAVIANVSSQGELR